MYIVHTYIIYITTNTSSHSLALYPFSISFSLSLAFLGRLSTRWFSNSLILLASIPPHALSGCVGVCCSGLLASIPPRALSGCVGVCCSGLLASIPPRALSGCVGVCCSGLSEPVSGVSRLLLEAGDCAMSSVRKCCRVLDSRVFRES